MDVGLRRIYGLLACARKVTTLQLSALQSFGINMAMRSVGVMLHFPCYIKELAYYNSISSKYKLHNKSLGALLSWLMKNELLDLFNVALPTGSQTMPRLVIKACFQK